MTAKPYGRSGVAGHRFWGAAHSPRCCLSRLRMIRAPCGMKRVALSPELGQLLHKTSESKPQSLLQPMWTNLSKGNL